MEWLALQGLPSTSHSVLIRRRMGWPHGSHCRFMLACCGRQGHALHGAGHGNAVQTTRVGCSHTLVLRPKLELVVSLVGADLEKVLHCCALMGPCVALGQMDTASVSARVLVSLPGLF